MRKLCGYLYANKDSDLSGLLYCVNSVNLNARFFADLEENLKQGILLFI